MKIKRFTAAETRDVMRQVRETFGPDAVILSNRQVDGEIEIVAAVDYEDILDPPRAGARRMTARWKDKNGARPGVPAGSPEALSGDSGSERAGSRSWVEDSDPLSDRRPVQTSMAPREAPAVSGPGGSAGEPGPIDWRAAFGEAGGHPLRAGVEPEANQTLASHPEETAGDGAPTGPFVAGDLTGWGRNERSVAAPGQLASAWAGALTGEVERELRALRELMERQVAGLAWGDLGRRQPRRAALLRRLLTMGLSREVADAVAIGVPSEQDAEVGLGAEEHCWRRVLHTLAERLPVAEGNLLETGGVVALLGPTGVGKTTSLAKIAAHFRIRHGADSAALLTTDNFRVGAREQLRTYAHLLGFPFSVCDDSSELHDAISRHRSRRLILIDTAGMSQRDVRLAEQAAVIRQGARALRGSVQFHLVLSATTTYATLEETMQAFAQVPLEGCLVTKLDEATTLGPVMSLLIRHRLPIAFTCSGQRVPEDMERPNIANLLALAEQCAARWQAHHEVLAESAFEAPSAARFAGAAARG